MFQKFKALLKTDAAFNYFLKMVDIAKGIVMAIIFTYLALTENDSIRKVIYMILAAIFDFILLILVLAVIYWFIKRTLAKLLDKRDSWYDD